MATIVYDKLKTELDTGWWLEIDGEDYFFAESQCDLDEVSQTIEVPMWMVEKNSLESYIVS